MNGDLAGKVARVQRELQQLKYPAVADETGAAQQTAASLNPAAKLLMLSQAEAQGAAAGVSPAEVDAAVGAVRAELAAQVEALRLRLEEAEQRAEQARSAQQAASEAAAARLTVLEGRLRFLE
ncbi:hypothetical protein HaLaN_27254, partial [Haematococcus lacustris]